jgi:putative aldouronate transport system substrate-binding protein
LKKISILAVLLSVALCIGSLTACSKASSNDSGSKNGSSSNSEATNTDATEETGEMSNLNEVGFPIVNDTITMTVFGARDQNQADWDEVLVLDKYEKMTNVTMDYQEVPADGFDERKQLLFASNELPDIFLRSGLTASEIANYGVASGQIIPLDDLIEKYAPNLSAIYEEYPLLKKAATAPDGHLYTIPEIDISATGRMAFKQWINQEWLKAVGKEVPTTIEEFKDVLIAFRDEDPNGNGEKDEIPLGIREPGSIYQLGGSFGLQYQMRDTYNVDENGTLHNWIGDDTFKEYLMFMNELYSEKLLWQEYYTNDRPLWRSNLSNALFGAMYMPYSDVFLNVEEQFIGYDPLIGPNGDQLWSDAVSGLNTLGAFAISNTCENPEAAIRWVDYFFSEEGSIFFCYGEEGETYYIDDKGQARFNDEIMNSEEGFMTALGKINLVPGGGFPVVRTNKTDGTVATDLTKKIAADLAEFLPERVHAKPSIKTDDMERVNAIEQDLFTYRDEAVTKFILGEWGFDKWEEYTATLEQIGIRELETIYQSALDSQK